MSLRDRVFGDTMTGVCTTLMQKNNRFTVAQNVREACGLSTGDSIRVLIKNTESERLVKVIDSRTFNTTVVGRGQVQVPTDVVDDLELEEDTRIQYVVLKKDKVPSPSNGPVREAASPTPVETRPRDEEMMTFDATMAKTGQFTVPQGIREDMNIQNGDEGLIMAVHDPDNPGDPDAGEVDEVSIGTGNRVTIKKAIREELGLEPHEEVRVTLAI